MPELPANQRAAGSRSWSNPADDPHNGGPCTCDWTDPKNWTAANLRHRPTPTPDQSRYGPTARPTQGDT